MKFWGHVEKQFVLLVDKVDSHLLVCFKSVIFPTLTSFLECFFPFNSLCPAFSCQCPKSQQRFAASNWVQLPLWNAESFGDVQLFLFLVFDSPSNVLLLSQSKKLMKGCKGPLIPVPSFRTDTFQRVLWYLGAWPFDSLDGLLHTLVKEIFADRQNFQVYVLFCTAVEVGWYSMLAFQKKRVWFHPLPKKDGILPWEELSLLMLFLNIHNGI